MYNTPYQLKLPPEIEKIIENSDPVYTSCDILNQIDPITNAFKSGGLNLSEFARACELSRTTVYKCGAFGDIREQGVVLLPVITNSYYLKAYFAAASIIVQ